MKYFLTVIICFMVVITFSGLQAEKTYYQPQRAKWLDNGFIMDGESHESYIFRVRRGGAGVSPDEWERWLNEHKESTIQKYRDEGVEVFHTHGYKGFGYEAEKKEMELLREESKVVHRLGMKLDTYCQVMTVVPETFYAEEPRAKDWIQRDELGRPILLTYGFQQSYRCKPSLASQEYRKYYKEKIIKTLVQECKSDLLHFDNFDCNMEPESDKSPAAVAAFRDYLRKKYTPEQLIERFGHTNVHLIEPPFWNQTNNPRNIREIEDPVQQEWIDFRSWLMADWLKEMTTYARSLNPDIAIDTNPHGLFGVNRAFNVAIWHPWFLKYTEIMWTEEVNDAAFDSRGVLISKIRSYKMGRTLDNFVLAYKGSDRALAEGLAFNQTIGNASLMGKGSPQYDLNKKYCNFYLENRQLYTGTQNREDAAILRTYHTMAYDNYRAELEMSMFEQAMIQAHVPFDIVFDEQMTDLSRYKVLVLVGQNNLSREHIERIGKFVAAGGGLVVTGETSRFDKWGRSLSRPGLADVLGMDRSWVPGRGCFANEIKITKGGRVVYLPEIIPPDKAQAASWKGSWDGDAYEGTWILPSNFRDLAWAIRQAAGGRLGLEVGAPEWVAVEQVEKENQIMIHLVNYRQGDILTNLPVDLRIDGGKSVSGVRIVSPDRPGVQELKFTMDGDRCRLTVPVLQVYDVIAVTLSNR